MRLWSITQWCMPWYDTWWWWCDDACYDDALYDVHTLLHFIMMMHILWWHVQEIDVSQTLLIKQSPWWWTVWWWWDELNLMMTCSDLDVWWLDSNQQCWWVLMSSLTSSIDVWYDSDDMSRKMMWQYWLQGWFDSD